MKNENKCFFSISLENGITITGNNPEKVASFLMDSFSAFTDSYNASIKEGFTNFAKKCEEYQTTILKATKTIKLNYKH